MDTPSCDGSRLLALVEPLIDEGRLVAARHMLNAALALTPSGAHSWEIEARLLLLEGSIGDALLLLDQAVAHAPDALAARLRRSSARMKKGDQHGALLDAAECVLQAPGVPFPKALLGVLLWQADRSPEALSCLRDAVASNPADPGFLQALASVQDCLGNTADAAATLAQGIARMPEHVGLRNSAILLCMRSENMNEAQRLASAACDEGVCDSDTFTMLGDALASQSDSPAAARAYEESTKLRPGTISHDVSSLTHGSVGAYRRPAFASMSAA
ncbi:MAG TPA: tetratricopeptide repeat protein [Bradyrhizobium sp.]